MPARPTDVVDHLIQDVRNGLAAIVSNVEVARLRAARRAEIPEVEEPLRAVFDEVARADGRLRALHAAVLSRSVRADEPITP